jgi:hypothetical protein
VKGREERRKGGNGIKDENTETLFPVEFQGL